VSSAVAAASTGRPHLTRPLRVGVRVPPVAPSPRLRRFVARCVAAGFDSLWWPDHLMALSTPALWPDDPPELTALHTYCDPFVAMAACGDLPAAVSVGTGVTDAIRRTPAALVQSALTVDWAVPGPVILGLGAGERANYVPYGMSVPSPAAAFDRAARQIRSLLDSPGPDACGAVLGLRPADPVHPPQLWLGAHGPRGLRLTGQVADGWLPTQLGPEEWAAGRSAVIAAAVEAGRDPGLLACALSMEVVVADSRAEAVALLAHPVVRATCLMLPAAAFSRYGVPHPLGPGGLTALVPTLEGDRIRRAAEAVPDELVRETVIHGDVADVVAAIGQYRGLDHVRLSDLGGTVRPGRGGLARLAAVAAGLRSSRVAPAPSAAGAAGVERSP